MTLQRHSGASVVAVPIGDRVGMQLHGRFFASLGRSNPKEFA